MAIAVRRMSEHYSFDPITLGGAAYRCTVGQQKPYASRLHKHNGSCQILEDCKKKPLCQTPVPC